MALRMLYISLAIAMLISSGCRNRSNYQPSCQPAVVATAPACPAPCPAPGAPIPPPPFPR